MTASLKYTSAVLDRIEAQEQNVARLTDLAEQSAKGLVGDGRFLIGGSHTGFASEGLGRSGGFMCLKSIQSATFGSHDSALIGVLDDNAEDRRVIEAAAKSGASTLIFTSKQIYEEHYASTGAQLVDNFSAPMEKVVEASGVDDKVCRIDTVGNVIALWTFTAELLGALLRLGKMPAMYQSIKVEGSGERNGKYAGLKFHDNIEIEPVAAGRYGLEYLDELKRLVQGVKDFQLSQCQRAGQLVRDAVSQGAQCYCTLASHYPPHEPGREGDPNFFKQLDFNVEPAQLNDIIAPDDVFFCIGYTEMPTELLEVVQSEGARSICAIAGAEGAPIDATDVDEYIDPQWKLGDAIVEVKGYDVKVLPPSAVIQAMLYWNVVGEAAS